MIEMLIGVPLFTADTEEDMLLQIKDLEEGIVCIGSKAFNDLLGLSPAGMDLLAGLLSVEPDKRPTAPEALAHRWFTDEAAESPAAAKAEFPGFVPLFSES
jgi:cell division cycle 2-like